MCIAESAISEAQRAQTKADVCTGANECVPAAFVAGTPVTCNGGLLGAGVCMDKGFDEMMSAGMRGSRGLRAGQDPCGERQLKSCGCGPTETCLPCAIGSGQDMRGCD